MRVGFVVSNYPDVSETFISRKIDFLTSGGHEVVVLRTKPRAGSPPVRRDGNLWIENLHVGNNGFRDFAAFAQALGKLGSSRTACRAIMDIASHRSARYSRFGQAMRCLEVASYRLDLLHVHFVRQLLPVLGIPAALRIPLIVSMWGFDGFDAVDLGMMCHEVSLLHAPSHFVVRGFRNAAGCAAPIEVLPPEIQCSTFDFDRRYEPRTRYRVLTVARLHWMKGVLYGIHVAHELKARGVPILYEIVGDGPQRAECQMAIRDLGLEEEVRIHGAKQPDEVPGFLREADVFLFPSVQETFGVALLEAQASGLPVVATRVGGIPEAVDEPHSAWLLPPRDVRAMADAVQQLLENVELRRKMGGKGREYAKRFDYNLIGSKLLSMYEKVLSKN